ncbi:universal stress protein UspA [Halobacteriales archaeon QS_1_67_19]|nr:MAG: universal stress protein UspA [Halobacteriales archaeon QS_1_67_19]
MCLLGEYCCMTTYLVGTDGLETSAALSEYLGETVREGDVVHVVCALGPTPEQAEIDRGEEAIAVFADGLGDRISVEHHRPIRSTPPARELLITAREVDADRIVVGLRQHSRTERVISGSTAQDVLKNADRPVVAVPLDAA